MVVMLVVQLFGTVRLVHWWRVTRAEVLRRQRAGVDVPVHLHEHSWDLPLATADAG